MCNIMFDICMFQEVVLHRSSSDEKLGLTLCYGSLEDEVTDIFISEVSSALTCCSYSNGFD